MMNKFFTSEEINKLRNFIGYGKEDAEFIFIGIEEGGGGYDNLKGRLGYDDYRLLDCHRFHLDILNDKRFHNDSSNNVKLQPAWTFISYLVLRLKGVEKKNILKDNRLMLRDYQNNFLGTTASQGETLLTEVYPIPCSSFSNWGYKNKSTEENYKFYFEEYLDKKDYCDKVLPLRKKLLSEIISKKISKKKKIYCYGKIVWEHYEKLFLNYTFIDKNYYKYYLDLNINIFLLPFFGNGQFSYNKAEEIINLIQNGS